MASEIHSLEAQSPAFPRWQSAYEAVLHETDTERLFERVEVAEPALLMRLEEISKELDHTAERNAIDEALTQVRVVKRDRLGFR